MKNKILGRSRKFNNEELHSLYSSPSIIRMIKLRMTRWNRHVARTGTTIIHIGFGWEGQNERDNYEEPDISGRIILHGS
jgi:hypothetical protein